MPNVRTRFRDGDGTLFRASFARLFTCDVRRPPGNNGAQRAALCKRHAEDVGERVMYVIDNM
eukprot:3723085-Pyramimonas_sp.AAC.2